MHWRLRLWAAACRDWVLRVRYCHHNARVLVETEARLSCVLELASGGQMSKSNYTWPAMRDAINEHHAEIERDAYKEGCHDTLDEQSESERVP